MVVVVASSEPTRCYRDLPHANNNLGFSGKKVEPGIYLFFSSQQILKATEIAYSGKNSHLLYKVDVDLPEANSQIGSF